MVTYFYSSQLVSEKLLLPKFLKRLYNATSDSILLYYERTIKGLSRIFLPVNFVSA